MNNQQAAARTAAPARQIACEDVTLGYGGQSVASHITFEVDAGDYLCIVGENGAGKSTLMKTLLGLMPPLEGRITFAPGLGNRDIGYLPQQTEAQRDFPASVREIVLSGFQRRGFRPFYTRAEKARAQQNMARMAIDTMARRCYRELSGGQQQRVLLARALCAAGQMLLLDEPVAGLDPKVTAEMYELIAALNRRGMTIIMISHDIDEAVTYASHILHVGGRPFFGTREAYLASDIGRRFVGWRGGDAR